MFDLEAQIKRCDLKLRSEYPGITTDIYRINDIQYLIHCKNCYTDYTELKEEFNSSIRTIGLPVNLTLEKPTEYKELIKGIDFENIVSNFEGISITWIDIENILYSKFYDIDFNSIYENPDKRGEIIIEISDTTNLEQEKQLMKFLENIGLAFKYYRIDKVDKDKQSNPKKSFETKYDPMYCFTDKELEFSKRDSALWFENAESIFRNEFKKDNLYFYDTDKSKCFINCSMFENINLRNNILLYDTIYCSLPLMSDFDSFIKRQNIKKDELLELASKDRIKFLLTNTEKRYDVDFLNEAYKINSNSVITRRGINSIIACDIVEIYKNYVLNDINSWEVIGLLSEIIGREKGIDTKKLFSIFSWPIKSITDAFRTLNFSSPLAVSSFGVNTVIGFDGFPNQEKNKVEFEFVMNSHNIHIASALESTYFPFFDKDKNYSDKGVANTVGNLLNFYKNSAPKQLEKLDEIRRINNKERNMINLLGLKEPISIIKYEEYSQKYETTNRLKSILLDLEKMSEEERKKRIAEYSNLILKIGEEGDKKKIDKINYVLGIGGLTPYIGTVSSILALLKSIYDDTLKSDRKKVSKIIDKLSAKKYSNSEKDDIYILSKIDRIANLKS